MLVHCAQEGELRLMAESEIRMLDPEHTRKCLANTEAMLARLNADARGDDGFRYLERLSLEKMRDQLVSELAEYESYIQKQDCSCECDGYAQAIEAARQRNQVDADGNVRIGIADFQPRFLVTDDTK